MYEGYFPYSFVSLFEDNADVAQKILRYPRYYLPFCDESVVTVQEEIAKPEQIIKKRVIMTTILVLLKF